MSEFVIGGQYQDPSGMGMIGIPVNAQLISDSLRWYIWFLIELSMALARSSCQNRSWKSS